MADRINPIFVLGAPLCGTSTLVSILNAHPHAFVMSEVDFGLAVNKSHPNEEWVAWLPETEPLFGTANVANSLIRCGELLETKSFPFRSVGTKLRWLSQERMESLGSAPCVYIVRDPRTWAVKNRVQDEFYPQYFPDWRVNLLPPLAAYVSRLVYAHALPNRLLLRLEDVLGAPDAAVARLAKFLGLEDGESRMREWWRWTDWPDGHPKSVGGVHQDHASAIKPPSALDTRVEITTHPAWDTLLQLYYMYADNEPVSETDRQQALVTLQELGEGPGAKPEDLYLKIESGSM